MRVFRLLAALLALTLLSFWGYSGAASRRYDCVRQLLQQDELSEGVAVFTDITGAEAEVNQDWWSQRTGDTPMRMASLTKLITAGEIRRLVSDGQLGLDEPAAKFFSSGELDPAVSGVTIRRLLQHTAGVPGGNDDLLFRHKPVSCAWAADATFFQRRVGLPAQRVQYSNVDYCILGQLLLQRGERVDLLLTRALAEPLGGAGGWLGSLRSLYKNLYKYFPLFDLPSEAVLPDGSYYTYGWRHWRGVGLDPPWAHFGRLSGMLSIAVTDGSARLLVANFNGDPADLEKTSRYLEREAWRCLQLNE